MSSCHLQTNNLKEKRNKIRKRGSSSSSSSSSSLLRRYRFKRAILVGGKKGGCSTPTPLWKTRTKSPSMATTKAPLPSSGSKEKELCISARKLAATLWEINYLPPSRVKKELLRSNKEMIKRRDKASRLCRSPHMSDPDPSHTPFSERTKGFDVNGCKRRVSALSSHQLQFSGYYLGGLDASFSADLMEKVGNKPRNQKNCGKCTVGVKNRLKEVKSGLSTSKKLLKVLSQMCLQEQHSSSIPLILAMSNELDRIRNQIDQLIQEQSYNQNDMEYVMKHFAEEKTAWRRREREKIREATKSMAEELEVEKKLRKQTERLKEKIAKEMDDVKASYLKVSKELEREKRAKEIMEEICDELARGIGEDRAQVEEMKRESAKVREEVEKEREMLQLADVLREERVHMKLSEAKYQFEEKNAMLEKLRNELESFFKSKENGDDVNPEFKKLEDLELYLNKTTSWEFHNLEEENDINVGDGIEHENDSAESDLQSIELNMDNDSKSYKWSYACENVEAKRISIDKDIGRKSFSERIQWGSICFNKGTSNGKKRDFGVKIQEGSDQLDQERSIEFLFGTKIQEGNEETERYRPIMSLRDCLSFPNPAQRSGQPLTLHYIDGEAGENVVTLEGHNLKQDPALRK